MTEILKPITSYPRKTIKINKRPEIVTAMAIAGRIDFNPITDSINVNGKEFKFKEPIGMELPENGFSEGTNYYLEPLSDESNIEIKINEKSTRLQKIDSWAPWNGEDFVNLPILVKVKGKNQNKRRKMYNGSYFTSRYFKN
jgi:aconitate hydratase